MASKTANEIAAELETEAKRLQELANILKGKTSMTVSERIKLEKEATP